MIEIVRPEVRQWSETVSASGWLQPWQEAVTSSEVRGLKTIDVRADVGSTVKRGDLSEPPRHPVNFTFVDDLQVLIRRPFHKGQETMPTNEDKAPASS